MTKKVERDEKADEKEIFELLAKAGAQYQAYLDICNTTNAALQDTQTNVPEYSWDHPLTLTMNKDR